MALCNVVLPVVEHYENNALLSTTDSGSKSIATKVTMASVICFYRIPFFGLWYSGREITGDSSLSFINSVKVIINLFDVC